MPEENAHLPLAIAPEELEMAEIAVLLDFLRENAARHDVSELREQALAVGYRASVVDRAVADFDEELQSFLETEPAPEPPPVRVEERPRPEVSPVPVPPPPKVPAFFERLAEAERAAKLELSRSQRQPVSPGLALLVVVINAALLSLVFTGKADLAILAYSAEFAFALLLGRLQKTYYWRRAEELQTERIAIPVHSEPSRTPVPTIAHEVRTDASPAQSVPRRTPSRHG